METVAHIDQAAAKGAGTQKLTSHRENGQCAGKTDALRQTIDNGSQRRILIGKRLRTAQNDAVHDNQRDKHTQRVGQRRDKRLEQKIHTGNKTGNDHNECRNTYLVGNNIAQQRNNQIGAHQHQCCTNTHTNAIKQ